jgi:hypothetical protein
MTSIELPAGLTSIAPARADRRRAGVQRVVKRAAGSRLRVTALNSTPVIFYPTDSDTFAAIHMVGIVQYSRLYLLAGNVLHYYSEHAA